jgi:drug/metabolite transporter (DMT)-like permease
MKFVDFISLIHPVLAVVFVFPLIGVAANFAWQTRQRRLQSKEGGKSKIPPAVGPEHLKIGRWLAASVVGVNLIALAYSVVYGYKGFIDQQKEGKLQNFSVIFIILMFILTIASLYFLYRARQKQWRGIFATLTGMGLLIIGSQDGVWRMSQQWYWSHYWIGMAASLLMIFSLAIVEDIYKDRTNRWRMIHTVLNCLALLLFLGQGMTGSRDLLEIPLSWQKEHLYKCDFKNKTCPGGQSSIDSSSFAETKLQPDRIFDF